MCKIAPFAATLSVNVSVYTLVLISLDRYRHIVNPYKHKIKTNECYIILAILWTLSLLLSLVKLINFKTDYTYRLLLFHLHILILHVKFAYMYLMICQIGIKAGKKIK